MNRSARASLQALLERLAEGDRSALEPTYKLLWPEVSVFCRRLLGDDGDDLAQRVLMKLFAQAERFDRSRDGYRWVMTLAAWECRSELRKRARRSAARFDPAGESPPPDQLHDLRRALDQLSPDDVDAIASALRPQSASARIRKRRSRALRRLRELLS